MLPRHPEVVRCSHCGGYYWLRQAEKVGYLERSGMAEGFRAIRDPAECPAARRATRVLPLRPKPFPAPGDHGVDFTAWLRPLGQGSHDR
jgi:hypothetical protein